jgi:hydrogenase-4 component F
MMLVAIVASYFAATVVALLVKNRRVVEAASVLAGSIAFIAALLVAYGVSADGIYQPNVYVAVDAIGALVLLLITAVSLAAAAYAVPYLRKEMAKGIIGLTRVRQYYALVNLFVAAMAIAAMASQPVVAWIFLEVTTLSTVFLISYYNNRSTIEAAWKYLIVNAVGLLLAFFGTLLYFTSVAGGAEGLISWQALAANATHLDPALARLAFVFILIGYGTKVGLAPMHTWKPDAYGKSPAPIGALFSGALLPLALVTMLRFKDITDAVVGVSFSQHLLIGFGLLSMCVAALSILTVRKYKRLLAYSSIEHAGIMLLGFAFGGLGAIAALVHMVYHSLIKASLFFLAGNLMVKYHSTRIQKIKAAATIVPVTSVLLLLGLFAATGFPPFGIFLTELSILAAGLPNYPIIAGVMLLAVVVIFIGFFRQANNMVFGAKTQDEANISPGEDSAWLLAPPAILLASVLILTFCTPPFIQTLIQQSVTR